MMDSFFFGGGFQIIFTLFFIFIAGTILFTIIRGIAQWDKNNHSPRLTVSAAIVAKRINVTHHNSAGDNMHTTSSTSYYVTFQFDSGDRLELVVNGNEYGMLAEGDLGQLSFQGTRFLGFERQI